MKSKIYPVFVILAGIFWGTAGLFVRALESYGLDAYQISAVRLISAAVIMFLFVLTKDKSLLKIKLKDIVLLAVLGIVSIFMLSVLYFETMHLASVSVAAILMYTAPIFVMIGSYFVFKEKPTKIKITAMIITFIGCALVSGIIGGGEVKITPLGFVTGIGSGIAYASYSILSKFALKKYSPYTVTVYAFLFAGLASLFVADFPTLFGLAIENKELFILYPSIGLVVSVLAFVCYTFGLSVMESGSASVLVCIDPVVSSLISVFILSEPISAPSVLGIIMILISIIILK